MWYIHVCTQINVLGCVHTGFSLFNNYLYLFMEHYVHTLQQNTRLLHLFIYSSIYRCITSTQQNTRLLHLPVKIKELFNSIRIDTRALKFFRVKS